MIFEVKCDERTNERTKNERTDRTHTHIVSFIVLDSCLNLQVEAQLLTSSSLRSGAVVQRYSLHILITILLLLQ